MKIRQLQELDEICKWACNQLSNILSAGAEDVEYWEDLYEKAREQRRAIFIELLKRKKKKK